MKTILLLEDDPSVMGIFRAVLKGASHTLIEATSAQAAVACGGIGHIDLLIADVTPPCSGIHIAFQLRAWMPHLKIILTSGLPPDMWDEQQSAELSELPSDSVRVLQKPFLPKGLLRTVSDLVGPPSKMPESSSLN